MGQLSFTDVDPSSDPFAGPTLRETTFVVVDLETTGGRASGDRHDAITEIGAVKVRGGEFGAIGGARGGAYRSAFWRAARPGVVWPT